MIHAPITCPYCNSLVNETGERRLTCPRCGEAFDALSTTDIAPQPSAAPALVPVSFKAPYRKPLKANRRLAFLILGVMGCMAAASLAYALYTQPFRRSNDKGIVKTNPKRRPPLDSVDSTDDTPTAPAKLAALGWLPSETNLIIGVHVRELLANKEGNALLTQPVLGSGITAQALARWIGFPINEIDHLVLGIRGDKILPTPTLIVRTRQDYDQEELLHHLKATRAGGTDARPVYQFERADAPALFSSWFVCCVDKRTAVYVLLNATHLQEIPATAQADLRQLSPELRDVVQQRLDRVGPLWIAGHADDWKKAAPAPLFTEFLFKKVEPKDRERLLKVSTFAASVQPEEPIIVQATFACGNDAAAVELQKYLDIPDGNADADWKAAHHDGWLTIQGRTSLQKVRAALAR